MLNKIIQNPAKLIQLITILACSLPMCFFNLSQLLDVHGKNFSDPHACYDCISGITMVNSSEGWALGYYSNILHIYQGKMQWETVPLGEFGNVNLISMDAPDDGWAVASELSPNTHQFYANQVFLHYQAGTWRNPHMRAPDSIRAIQMLANNDGWAVGDLGLIMHYDGQSWKRMYFPKLNSLTSLSMDSPVDGWTIDDQSNLFHFQKGTWTVVKLPDSLGGATLTGIVTANAKDVWVSTTSDYVLHFDGHTWTQVALATPSNYPLNLDHIDLMDSQWAIGYVSHTQSDSSQRNIQPTFLYHLVDDHWIISSIFGANTFPDAISSTSDAWRIMSIAKAGATQGALAHFAGDAWHIILVPREPEPHNVTLGRYGTELVILAIIISQLWLFKLCFSPQLREQTQDIWTIQLGIVGGMILIGGLAAYISEPLLFNYYNRLFRLIALFVTSAGFLIAFFGIIWSLVKQKKPKVAEEPLL